VLIAGGQRTRADLTDEERREMFEQYKLILQNSEQLLTRKQVVNNFFLSMNSAIMAVVGLAGKEAAQAKHPLSLYMLLIVLSLAGFTLCWHWCSLLKSYGRLIKAKQEVTMVLEEFLVASMVRAEMVAIGEKSLSLGRLERHITVIFRVIYLGITIASSVGVFHAMYPAVNIL
jgi:hypothetical protein